MDARVLLVEDNPMTRQVLRDVLVMGGFRVIEADCGAAAVAALERERPDIVLQDMILPDCEGPDLLVRLRATPGGDVPILALSGLPNPGEDGAGAPHGGFNDYLEKPVSPSALIMAVRAHVESAAARTTDLSPPSTEPGAQRRVVVILPAHRLDAMAGHLEREGWSVVMATDGDAALEEIRRHPPDAVIAGGVMAGVDGPGIAWTLASSPATAGVPVIIAPGEGPPVPADLAAACGAARVLGPGAPPAVVAQALTATLIAELRGAPPGDQVSVRMMRGRWLRAKAAYHEVREEEFRRRCDLQAAALAILDVMAASLASTAGVEAAASLDAGSLLARCLTTAGTSRGAGFMEDDSGALRLVTRIGFTEDREAGLRELFGHVPLLRRVMEERRLVVVPGPDLPGDAGRELLRDTGVTSLLLVPLHRGDRGCGVLLLGSSRFDLVDWVEVARSVAFQVSQALELGLALERLTVSEASHRALFDGSVLGIYRTDGEGRIVEANAAFARLLGFASPAAILGSTTEGIYRHPEERERIREKYRKVDRFDGIEVDWVRRDGAFVTVRLTGRSLRDGAGRHAGYEVFVEDITGRRELEEEIRQAQRMEAVRRLAAGVAHEYRNLLTAVAGHADLLLAHLPAESPLRAHAEAIQRAVETAEGVSHDLLAFGSVREGHPRVVDLVEHVDRLLPTLRRALGEDIELDRVAAGGPLHVRIDPARWESALLFLALHSRENMPDGGVLTVTTSRAPGEGDDGAAQALLEFRDNGRVLGEEERAHLLEPRFGQAGTSAGLATVYGLVRQSGGQVAVLRGAAGGTRIRILLPMVVPESTDAPPTAPPVGAPASGPAPVHPAPAAASILVAEDEEAVRGLVAATLRREGYQVLEASNGEEALRVAAQHRAPIHLLLTDVVMPRMGGRRLAQMLRSSRPGLPVLFVSGYTEHATIDEEGGASLDEGSFLQKPFTPRVLAARVREVLAEASSEPGGSRGCGGEPTA